jgi:hypothetical protein
MKEFRKLQKKAFFETPGCLGWGLGAPLGRCLDQVGVEDRLVELMDKAVAAAEASGDERAAAHMRREKTVFEMTWLAARRHYIENFKELNVYSRTGEIEIDGVLEEPDWKNADALGDFRPGAYTKSNVKVAQSSVRVVYDQDSLYIAVECLEPDTKGIVAGKGPLSDDIVQKWREMGDHVELFYNYPDMAEKYYHVAVNPYGVVLSAIHAGISIRDESFHTRAKVATKVLDDRWVLEAAIPTSEIGVKCFDGATWRLNVARVRNVKSLPSIEYSSCCNGAFHGVANFVNIRFAAARAKGPDQRFARVSAWSNAGFEASVSNAELHSSAKWLKFTFRDGDDRVPKGWHGRNLCGEYLEEGGNHFVRLLPGKLSDLVQHYVSDASGKVRVTFRMRGRGKAALWSTLYTNNPPGKPGYAQQKGTARVEFFDAEPGWKTFSTEREKNGLKSERLGLYFSAGKDSVIDIDDVFVSPMQ